MSTFADWLPGSRDFSEPAFGAGDAGGIDSIGGAKLGDCFGEIVADGAFGEVEFGGDFGAAAAVAGALQDLALAFGQRIKLGAPGFGGECGIDDAQTAMDAAYGVGELCGGTIFQQIAARACVKCAAQIAGAGEGGEDDGAHGGMTGAQAGGKLKPGHDGHLDVGDENVGGEAANGVERIATVGGAGDDRDVGLEFEQSGERAEHHGLVFGEDDADGWGGCGHRVTQGAFSWRGAVCGSSMRRVTPGSVVMEKTAAERLDALAHAAEAVALLKLWVSAVIGDEKRVVAIGGSSETHAAVGGLGVANDVGYRFTNERGRARSLLSHEVAATEIRRRALRRLPVGYCGRVPSLRAGPGNGSLRLLRVLR